MQKLTGSLQMTKHGLNLKGFIRQFQINTTLITNCFYVYFVFGFIKQKSDEKNKELC